MAVEFRRVKLTDAWLEGPRLRALRLDVSGTDFAARFTTPGQFVKVRIPGDLNDLFMALANAPGVHDFELLVQTEDPPDASKPATRISALRTGDSLEITAPSGKGFPIESEQGRDVLLFAGGSGISAIRSALEYVIPHRAKYGRVVLFFGVRRIEDLAYRASFAKWKEAGIEVEPTLSRATEGSWTGRVGYVQAALGEVKPDPSRSSVFFAGGKDFSDAVTAAVVAAGIDRARVFKNF